MKDGNVRLDIVPGDAVLDVKEREHAARLLQEHPAVNKAMEEFYGSWVEIREKYRALVVALVAANLGPREITLVLLASGFNKGRVSMIKTVVEAPAEVREKYLSGLVGFRPAYALARGSEVEREEVGVPAKLDSFFANVLVNGYDGPMPKGRVRLTGERMGWSWCLVLKKLVVVKAKKAKGKKAKGKAANG